MQLGIIGLDLYTTQQHNANIQICAMHFMDDSCVNLGEYKAGCAWRVNTFVIRAHP